MVGTPFVAPLVGAWIEIYPFICRIISVHVAPLVGAWIEISRELTAREKLKVAPLVGAWIEITSLTQDVCNILSLPSWERGLKYVKHFIMLLL